MEGTCAPKGGGIEVIVGCGLEFECHHPIREGEAPHNIIFSHPVTMKEGVVLGWAAEGKALVARFGYRLTGGH